MSQGIVNLPGQPVSFPHLRHALHVYSIIPKLVVGLIQLFIQLANAGVFFFLAGKQQNHIENKQDNVQTDHQTFQAGKAALDHRVIVSEVGSKGDALCELFHDLIAAKGKHQAEYDDKTQPHPIAAHIVNQVSKYKQGHTAVIEIQRDNNSSAQGDFCSADKNPQGKILYRTENLEKTHPEQHSIQAEGLNRHLPGIAGYLPHRSQKIMCTQTVTYPKSGGHTDQRIKGENR